MLPRVLRLTRTSDFVRARAQGTAWTSRTLVLVKCPNGLDHSRFGFSVSRRIGHAVVRNRIRRLLSEAIRLNCDVIAPGWDVILIARKGILDADYWSVERATVQLISSAGLLQAPQQVAGARG